MVQQKVQGTRLNKSKCTGSPETAGFDGLVHAQGSILFSEQLGKVCRRACVQQLSEIRREYQSWESWWACRYGTALSQDRLLWCLQQLRLESLIILLSRKWRSAMAATSPIKPCAAAATIPSPSRRRGAVLMPEGVLCSPSPSSALELWHAGFNINWVWFI